MKLPSYCKPECVIKNKENCNRSYRYCRRYRGIAEMDPKEEIYIGVAIDTEEKYKSLMKLLGLPVVKRERVKSPK